MPAPHDPNRTTDLPPSDAAQTTDLPAGDLARMADLSAPDVTGDYDPNRPTANFDPSHTGAYLDSDEPADDDEADLRRQVPGYYILGELGRGGMGVVWKALQIRLDRVVALKMILAGPHATAAAVGRFEAEARAVARFQHPNIVQIFEVGEFHGMPFFSLEFVDGGPLSAKIAREPQPPRYAADVAEKLARAMQYAHDRGVIHRDLKPANVLLAADGTPKVTDFGLAKGLDEDSGQTHAGQVLGTPSYMAPEQADGRPDVGPPADVYALGGVLYDLLTGRPPFAGSSVLDTLQMVRTREPVAPGQLAANLPRDVETICLKCLQKDPAKRYASAGELADDLRRFLDGRPILARPVSGPEKAWRWAKRNPLVAGFGTAAAVLLLATAVLGTTFAVVFDRQKTEAVALAQREEAAKTVAQQKQREAEDAREQERTAKELEKAANDARKAVQEPTNSLFRGVLLTADDELRKKASLAPIRVAILKIVAADYKKVREASAKFPNPLEERTDAIAHLRMAEALMRANEVAAAAELYERAAVILAAVARQNPSEAANVRNLANVTNERATALLRLGDAAAARDLYAEGLRLREAWVKMLGARPAETDPDARRRQLLLLAESRRSLGQSHALLGRANLRLGEPAAAAKHFETADGVFAAYPPRLVYSNDVRLERAAAQEELADAKFLLKDFAAAEKLFLSVLAAREKIPDLAAVSRLVYGDFLLTGKKDTAAAAVEFRKAFTTLSALLAKDEDSLDLQRWVAAAHYRLGVVARTTKSDSAFGSLALPAVAAGHFEESRRLRAALGAIDGRDTQGLVEWMLALGRCGKAAEARALSWFLLKQAGRDRRVLFQTACGLAVAAAGAADPALAERCRERAFQVLGDLVASGWKDRVTLETDPDLAVVRDDPRFQQLLERIPAPSQP